MEAIKLMGFVKFMVTGAGRTVRIVAGLVLIAVGLLLVGNIGGTILAVVGVLPLAAGLFDFCIFAPLFSMPFMGAQVRQM
jgi:hypothetical protein